jgi:hypothetical protein
VRVGILYLLLFSAAVAVGCYEQPLIPRDKPLRCDPGRTSADDPLECPVGFRCIASGVCALIDCNDDDDCTQGLVCTERTGCDLPGAGDGGTDGGTEAGGGLLPGGADALNPGPQLDAPVLLDSQPSFDLAGGGS